MRVAVTGARGFIGRAVLGEMARRGVAVTATERPGAAGSRPGDASVRWVPLDIAAPPADAFAVLGSPEALLHLAWDGLPNYRLLHHLEHELPRQFAFLAGLVRGGLPALVTVGTCFEYGMQSGPLEAGRETRPTNPYGFAKDTLRRQLQFLQGVHPFKFTWARLFYMYGDGQVPSSLLPLLQEAVAEGRSEFPMSGGEQLRDYLPVAEVARRLVDLTLEPRERGPINVCSGAPISVRRLVEGWIAENGWHIVPRFGMLPYPDYEPMAFWGLLEPADNTGADDRL